MIKPAALATAAALALATACTTLPDGPTFEIRAAMQQRLNPAVLAIRGTTRNALDDEGRLDPAKVDAAGWQRIVAGAEGLSAMGHDMAMAGSFVAAAPDNSAVRPGELTMAEVQRLIDRDPSRFRQLSYEFAVHADRIAAAARARDAAETGRLVAELDGLCSSCHASFWRPQ